MSEEFEDYDTDFESTEGPEAEYGGEFDEEITEE
jgi:hypothetical protein